MNSRTETRDIRVAHSPDSDDAFMFYALARQRLDTGSLRFVHELHDIETLNRRAVQGYYEVSAISFHAYAYVADQYAIMPAGASMGDRYGPIVVARDNLFSPNLRGKKIAVPGAMTTAYLALRLCEPEFAPQFMPFDHILDAVVEGRVDAGLLIHEGQLTYHQMGLAKVVDLGEWWYERHRLPLPLGCNVIRKDLGPDLMHQVCHWLNESIRFSLEHREEALAYARQFARGLDPALADRFVGMYVNQRTVGYTAESRHAVELLLEEGCQNGIIPRRVRPEFVE